MSVERFFNGLIAAVCFTALLMIGLVIFSLIGSPNQEREVCGKLARVEWSGTEGKASFEFDQYREYIIHDFGVYTDLKSTLGQQICVTVYGAILTEVKP